MSFHFVSHSWLVHELNATSMSVSLPDLDESAIAVLADELFDLSLAEGRPILYLNLQNVRLMPNDLIGQFAALDAKLRDIGGRLGLQNMDPAIVEFLHAAGIAGCLRVEDMTDG